jgi:hypothetical protein
MAAREEAARANAQHLARALFAAAAERAAEADAALGKQDVANAQQRYREALEGYRLAKAEATRIAPLVQATRAAENRVGEARRAAERVEAPKRAPVLWAKAGSAQARPRTRSSSSRLTEPRLSSMRLRRPIKRPGRWRPTPHRPRRPSRPRACRLRSKRGSG